MEQFVVSARKYRPQTFKDVVGQNYQYFIARKTSQQHYYLQDLVVLEKQPPVFWLEK
jgi:hypothetical protein